MPVIVVDKFHMLRLADEALTRQYAFRAAHDGRQKAAVDRELDTIRAQFARVKAGQAPAGAVKCPVLQFFQVFQ